MATLEEVVFSADYPQPVGSETLESYAKRIALIGAHLGVGWSMTHTVPAVVQYIPPQDPRVPDQTPPPGLDDLPDLADTDDGSFQAREH